MFLPAATPANASLDNWKSKFQLALLNSHYLNIAFSQPSDIIYFPTSWEEPFFKSNLPVNTAKFIGFKDRVTDFELIKDSDMCADYFKLLLPSICYPDAIFPFVLFYLYCLENVTGIQLSFFHELFQKNKKCSELYFDISPELSNKEIELLCKSFAKNCVSLKIINSPQKELFEDILFNFKTKYKPRFDRYAPESSNQLPRKRTGTEALYVPTDRAKRLKFLVNETQRILNQNYVENEAELMIPVGLIKVTHESHNYRRYDRNIEDVDLNVSFLTLKSGELNNAVRHIATELIESIIIFNNIYFYVTSGDLFLHNHWGVDDCAYGLDQSSINRTPKAVIKKNSYLNSSLYYELSIYWGFYEILITGGYYVNGDSESQPFLGSSIAGWEFEEMESTYIYANDRQDSFNLITSERLLNQYSKRDSHRPWGL